MSSGGYPPGVTQWHVDYAAGGYDESPPDEEEEMPQEVVQLPARPGAAHSLAEIEKLAEAVARSGMFGIRTKEQAMVLMAISQAEGRHPALAARDYDVIQGRPAKKAEAMLRDFLDAGGKVQWHALTDETADATFSHPSGGSVRITWDQRRAAQAGLQAKDMYKKFPRAMLRSRCVSEGVRTVWPMATSGLYVPEEVRELAAEITAEPASDTTEALDQFAAVTGEPEPLPERNIIAEGRAAAQQGRAAFGAFWKPLSQAERDSLTGHLAEFERTAKTADDPFGLPPPRSAIWQDDSYRIEPGAGPPDPHGNDTLAWDQWTHKLTFLIGESTATEIAKLREDNKDLLGKLRLTNGDLHRDISDAIVARMAELDKPPEAG